VDLWRMSGKRKVLKRWCVEEGFKSGEGGRRRREERVWDAVLRGVEGAEGVKGGVKGWVKSVEDGIEGHFTGNIGARNGLCLVTREMNGRERFYGEIWSLSLLLLVGYRQSWCLTEATLYSCALSQSSKSLKIWFWLFNC
jgi:hypothetical protein